MATRNHYLPQFDADAPVDLRVVKVLANDGVTLEVPEAPTFSNPDDPVSPQLTTEAVGAEDPPASQVHAFPDDPSLVPVYAGPPQTP